LRHTPIWVFLTAKSRSGRFFASPSYHLHLLYRCFVLTENKQYSGTVAVSYSISHWEEHLEQFIRLSPSTPGPLPALRRFPQTLDALYAHILAKAQNIPHFSDIISTIAFLFEPLPIPGIAELLGVTVSEVAEVLDHLREVFDSPRRWSDETDTLLVTFRHASLLDFLTTESRSGPFYVPPSFHRFLSYRYLILWFELSSEGFSPTRMNPFRWSQSHLDKYQAAISAEDIVQVTRVSSQNFPSHVFFTTAIFSCELFGVRNHISPGHELEILTKCMELLALALENVFQPVVWMHKTFQSLKFPELTLAAMAEDLTFNLDQEQVARLQNHLRRIETAIRTKVSL
jgi:hypothetical protein